MKKNKFLITHIVILIVYAAFMTGLGVYYAGHSSLTEIFGEVAESALVSLLFLSLPYIFIKALVYVMLIAGAMLLLSGIATALMLVFKRNLYKINAILKANAFLGVSLVCAVGTILLFVLALFINDLLGYSDLLIYLSVLTALGTVWQIFNFKAMKEWKIFYFEYFKKMYSE